MTAMTARALGRLRVVRNCRPVVDWNTCGQAAVATVLGHFRVAPFAPDLPTFSDAEAIDYVREGFPPDVPFGLGTSAPRLGAALRRGGLVVEHVHSGWFGYNHDRALDRLRSHLDAGHPAIVCVDQGLLGGPAWSAHWAIAVEMNDRRVSLAGVDSTTEISVDLFMRAWRCRHLPYSHNHCALLPRAGRQSP